MKNHILTLLFIIITVNFCFAQDTVKIEVPQLLEAGKIDSLMLSVIKSSENLKSPKNDSCLLLSLTKNENFNYIHGIQAINNRETIFSTGNFDNQINLGCFEIGGYQVFVIGDETVKKFFADTHQKREFTFIRPTAQQNIFVILNYVNLAIAYKDGVFGYKAR